MARAGDHEAFTILIEPHRRELTAYCYRILGSIQDAEDLVQETILRAWQHLDSYEGRGTLRAWLYKIATHACFDVIAKRPKRTLPPARYPAADPRQPYEAPIVEPIWLEPFPDDLISDERDNPDTRYMLRESISLAFIAALQWLTPSQRVVLILRDVLGWRAQEVADSQNFSVSKVNSLLHRARTALAAQYEPEQRTQMAMPDDDQLRALLEQYVYAWENADVEALIALLHADAIFTMPPLPGWYVGHINIRLFMATVIFSGDRNRWRLLPTHANGQIAFALYEYRPSDGAFHAYAIQVLTIRDQCITALHAFMTPRVVTCFGLPEQWR